MDSDDRDPQLAGGEWITLYLMRIDATEARLLSQQPPASGVYEQQSAWSPDGKWIAYAGCGALQCGIYLISFDGRTHGNLAAPSRFVTPQYPAWSPSVNTRLRWWVVLGVGAALVAAGIAPWSRTAWASRPQAIYRKDRERPLS
jgi:hypothetical protein